MTTRTLPQTARAAPAVSVLNEAALRRRAEENDPRAQRLLPMVEQARALHTAARTGCTLAGLFAAAFAAIRVSSIRMQKKLAGYDIIASSLAKTPWRTFPPRRFFDRLFHRRKGG